MSNETVTNEIKYLCPDYYNGYQTVYPVIFEWFRTAPYIFNEGVSIHGIYGSFPLMIWNGGGILPYNYRSFQEIPKVLEYYDSMDIPLYMTATNPLITEADLEDRHCNNIMDLFAEYPQNKTIVASPLMEDYIATKYPEMELVKSIISTRNETNYVKELKYYSQVVLARRDAKNIEVLKSIPDELKGRCEILLNDPCPANCPRLYDHYEAFAKVTLYDNNVTEEEVLCLWEEDRKQGFPYSKLGKDIITFEDIQNRYVPLGYSTFKISGRGSDKGAALSVIEYLIKPEYHVEALSDLFNKLHSNTIYKKA